MSDSKSMVLISILIVHYIAVLTLGMFVCGWSFIGSLLAGTFFIILTTAVLGTGLIAPAVVVCMILAALNCFNIFYLLYIITASGVSACLLSEGQ